MGVLAMFLWLALGWLAGTAVWLFGMAMIALGTWVMRPPRSPGDLWDEAPPVDLHPLFQAGRSMLGAGWEQVAELFGALPAAGGAVWFTRLERGAEVATLRSRFTPEGLLAILGCVAPLDDRLLVHAPGSR